MNDLSKIPVTVITGFLGSGKTTLIRHLMTNAGGRRLAVLVNEFGTVGVDGDSTHMVDQGMGHRIDRQTSCKYQRYC